MEQWGHTLASLKRHVTTMGRIREDEILRVTVYLANAVVKKTEIPPTPDKNGKNTANEGPQYNYEYNDLKGIITVFPGSCAMLEDAILISFKNLKGYLELQQNSKTENYYVSELAFSPLLGTWLTTICTHYTHPMFNKTVGDITHQVVTCIDTDMSKLLRIERKQDLEDNAITDTTKVGSFLVTDNSNKIIKMNQVFKLPFANVEPYKPHMIPVTGIKNVKEYEAFQKGRAESANLSRT